MKTFILCVVFIFFSMAGLLFAQAPIIRGKVVDSEQRPVAGIVVVVQTIDSVYVNTTTTDSLGLFQVATETVKSRLLFQHWLFESKEMETNGDDAGTIVLSEKDFALNEVVIKSERPIVQVSDGKLTYNVELLVQNKVVSNAYESLLQLPGISEQNGILTLAGANKLTIILNGKPTTVSEEQLINLLKNTPVSKIKTAEVMYSAPAKYHVRGAAINLVMNRAGSDNSPFQGEFNGTYAQKQSENLSSGVSFLFSTPKFSTDFLYTINQYKRKTGENYCSMHTFNDSIYDIEMQDRAHKDGLTYNVRLGLDYLVDEKNKLSLVYTGELTPSFQSNQTSNGNFSTSNNQKDGSSAMHNIGLDYTSGFGFSTGLNYTYFDAPFTQNFHNTDAEGNSTDFITQSRQKIDRIKLNVDQTHTLPKDWSLNYGAAFFYAKDKDFQTYTSKDGVDRSAFNTNNTINEYTATIYGGFAKSFSEKFSMNFSLSGEYFQLADFNQWSVYPAGEMTYVFTPKHILQFSLSTDKTYPSYWEVQESIGYMNGYAMLVGNPLLKPYKDYSAQLTYILKSKYLLTAYYSYQPDYFVQLPYQSSEQLVLIYQTLNWNFSQVSGLNMVVPFQLGRVLDSRVTLNGYNQRAKDDHFHEISFDRNRWVLYTQIDNTIKVSSRPDIKMEVSGFYITPPIQGIYDLSAVWSFNAGIKWTFADKKAELRLKGSDIFNSSIPELKIRYGDQHLDMHIIPDSRTISLSFSYKFGGYKTKERKKVDTSRFGHE